MSDVARHAGVSRALVSIVMRGVPGASEATRERVFQAARAIGYVPDEAARRLSRARSGGTGIIGVVFAVGQPFHQDLLESLYDALCAESPRDLVLSGTTPARTQAQALQALLRERCEAVLVLGADGDRIQLADVAASVPVVSLLRRVRIDGVDCVISDESAGMAQAVRHLAGLGHRRIVHVHGGRAAGARQRLSGHRRAIDGLGLPEPEPLAGGLTEDDGARAAHDFLAGRDASGLPATAVTVFNDRCALGFIDTLRGAGVGVPQEVSVVGFDDIRAAGYAHISLTTIRQDADRLALLALERAAARIAEPAGACHNDVVAPHLVVRGTTAAPA